MKEVEYKGSIKKRLITIIIFVTTITGAIGYGSFIYSYMELEHKRSIALANTIANVISQDIAKLTLLNDVSAAADITSQVKSFSTLESMVLYNLDKKALFQYSKENKSFIPHPFPTKLESFSLAKDNLLTLYIEASYQNTHLGYAELQFKVQTMFDIIKRDSKMLLIIIFFVLSLSYLLAIYYAKQFTRPILELVKFLEKIEFATTHKLNMKTIQNNEYGKLYEEVNGMLERMESSQKNLKIASVAFETQSGMTITDADQKILRINKAFSTITGYTQEEAIGQTPSILNSGMQDKEFYVNMHENLEKFHHWSGEIHNRHKDGTVYPEYLTIQAVVDENQEIIYYVASFLDLTLQKKSEEKIQYLEEFDTLTGLANRNLIIKKTQHYMNTTTEKGWSAIIGFNIKDFKTINDAYGYSNGDELLKLITKRIQTEFSESDLIAKIGIDEFALCFHKLDESKESASIEAKEIAEQLIRVLTKSFMVDSKEMHIMLYSGIALYNQDDKDAYKVFKEVNTALNIAKKEDKLISFYDEQAQNIAREHLGIYSKLLVALEKEEFELYYQLQYNTEKEIYGAEALIRWNHPDGLISPDAFIPIAEKTGLILPIGLWVIQAGCAQLAQWQQKRATEEWVLAINISAKQFIQKDFLSQIKEEILKSGIDPHYLKVELTESLLVDDIEEIITKMKALQELGVRISLDDFGTGYSSLEYLKNLPLNQVKIDQSFVRNMLTSKGDIAIIQSVILLGEALSFEVIAEGVETKEHYELLKELGCELFQGYYFARPQKIENIII